ncbi:MAG TPA: helix-turn-helix domain-containing protein [Dongiaceae bacterium]|jgi:AcrR family transcriptional regulator|nr:helix-turn-helix domain-containing protein [Dongiaceae bacterium]
MTTGAVAGTKTRHERRRRKNREALINAGYKIIAEKGIDAATMAEIAEAADVGAGTAYNHFASKDELVMVVMEQVMHRLAIRIKAATESFDDPAQVFAFGVLTTMQTATTDSRWRWLLRRSEVIADAMFRVLGPYAIHDLERAAKAKRFRFRDAALVYRMATHAIVGFCLTACDGETTPGDMNEAVVLLLGLAGMSRKEAEEICKRNWPKLPRD